MVDTLGYRVVKKLDKVEIRSYPRMLIAKVDGYGDGGFDLLFRFITGENSRKAKVAMTAPVLSENIPMTAPVLSGGGSLAFVMPESYTIETTPMPVDGRVKIVEIPTRNLAVLRFSGRWSKGVFDGRSKEMLGELQRAGIRIKGEVFSMRYNAPFTPWFLRRNEVAVEVPP